MPGKRTTEADVAMRVEAVRRLILQGANRYDILQFVAKNWCASARMADDYVARARQSILEAMKPERAQNLAEHIEARRDIRRKANEAKDHRLVLDVLKDEAKLMDLYPADRSDVRFMDMSKLTDEELRAIASGKSKG